MVEVKYVERLGNNLFQYCFGRILAEKLGFKLKADPIPGFPNTRIEIKGHDYSSYPAQILLGDEPEKTKRQKIDLSAILRDRTERKIVVDGYFQRYEYYKAYKEVIRNDWLLIDRPQEKQIGSDDIVVYIRRSDYIRLGYALPFSYYEKALKMAKEFDNIYVCTDDVNDPFISLFNKYKPIIYHTANDPLKDFRLMISFNKIIQSASSFSWWASFLSKAKEIYTPMPLFGHWSAAYPGVDLRVDDEDRYIYLRCNERYKKSITERVIEAKKRPLSENLEKLKNKVCTWIK